MLQFDFTNTDDAMELSEISDYLSADEAEAAMKAIRKVREEKENMKAADFETWFEAAFLPVLKGFASDMGTKLTVSQDRFGDVTATFTSRCGIDITSNDKWMRMVLSSADHISVSKKTDSDEVEFTLIFGLPEQE